MTLILALSLLLPGWLAAPAAAAAPPAAMERPLADVASGDAAVQEQAAVALGKTGDPKILPLLEALREGSVYVRTAADGKKETVIVGDKVTDGDKTMVPLFSAYGREALVGAGASRFWSSSRRSRRSRRAGGSDSPCARSSTRSRGRATCETPIRPRAARRPPRWATPATRPPCPTLVEALAKESDRWARHAMEEAIALINLRSGDQRREGAGRAEARRPPERQRPRAPAGPGRRRSQSHAAPAGGPRLGQDDRALGPPRPRRSRRSSRASRSPPSCS